MPPGAQKTAEASVSQRLLFHAEQLLTDETGILAKKQQWRNRGEGRKGARWHYMTVEEA